MPRRLLTHGAENRVSCNTSSRREVVFRSVAGVHQNGATPTVLLGRPDEVFRREQLGAGRLGTRGRALIAL
jgi:hypothetical protein